MTSVVPSVAVSDHALVRYLERVCGIDIARLKADIARQCAAGLEIGDAVSIRGAHEYVIHGGVLVTVQPRRGRR